jgi:hypothetical protein
MSNGGNTTIVAGGLSRQQIIDCFTKAGVWLGTNNEEIDRQVNAVKLAIEESQKPNGRLLPVKPWEELHASSENAGTPEAQIQSMGAELANYRRLFTCSDVDYVSLAGTMTSFQHNHLRALAFNMQPFGREGLEQIIRAAAVTGYTNAHRDFKNDSQGEPNA